MPMALENVRRTTRFGHCGEEGHDRLPRELVVGLVDHDEAVVSGTEALDLVRGESTPPVGLFGEQTMVIRRSLRRARRQSRHVVLQLGAEAGLG